MQLSETITIYLAIAAPFGVNYFLRERAGAGRHHARSLFKASVAGLLWPLAAVASLLSRQASLSRASTHEREGRADESATGRAAAAERQLFAALERMRELALKSPVAVEELEQKVRSAREGFEKYLGLTEALLNADPDAEPANREMELCRVAGRSGDDLLLAGRCVRRRNVTRLILHQARSRTELLDALAALRELISNASARSATELRAARHTSVAMLRFYGHAINLLSLLEDESAVRNAAGLLDMECARLRRLEASSSNVVELLEQTDDEANSNRAPHAYV